MSKIILMSGKYGNFINHLSGIINKELDLMEAVYNFDNGDEFEIALCRVLRNFLPEKYGICRGFIVDQNNNKAGDDIIIFDKENFPTLRSLEKNDYSRKEQVPFDAVYAYIEAKYTLRLDDNIHKAIDQISKVKALSRNDRFHNEIVDDCSIEGVNIQKDYRYHKDIQNPMVCVIFSRYVGWGNKRKNVNEFKDRPEVKLAGNPEMIVCGNDVIYLPAKEEENSLDLYLFCGTGEIKLYSKKVEGKALALGVISLLNLLDKIKLKKIDWLPIIQTEGEPI